MLSDQKTFSQLRLRVRRELKDANEHLASPKRWWTDTELNEYLETWMQDINWDYYLLMTSTTTTIGSATATVTISPIIHRLNRLTWNNVRLTPTTRIHLDSQHPTWAQDVVQPGQKPTAAAQIDNTTVVLYPTPGASGVLEMIGPQELVIANDTDVCPLPAWTYYSARLFCAYLAYLRAGPNQDLRKASRYKQRYDKKKAIYRKIIDARFAAYGPRLKPATAYEGAILNAGGR